MKKKHMRCLAALLAMLLALTACGGGNSGGNDGGGSGGGSQPIKDIVLWETTGNRELENFFMLNTENAGDLNVLANAYSPLLEIDSKGELCPAIATSWEDADNGLTWTFHLRDDVTWVDVDGNEKAKCTAQDWLTALEWVLNYHKNASNNVSMPTTLIAGAADYYAYTESLTPEEAMALKSDNPEFQKVGVKAPDDNTLVYTCAKPAPYFDTLCTSACLYPISQAEIDEKGVDGMVGMNNKTMWYNGPYLITDYVNNNSKELKKNPAYWDKECSLFDSVRIVMVESGTIDDTLYETGEVDQTELNIATLRTILDNPEDERNAYLVETRPMKYSYQWQMNFTKHNEDGSLDTNWNTAVANENFRQSLLYGVNLKNYWVRNNPTNPLPLENLCFTMKGLLKFSDGTDYTDRVIEKLGYPASNGDEPRRFDPDKALDYKAKAMEELSTQGVTFPVQIDYYVQAGSNTGLDNATRLKECFENTLGSDYVNLNIKTYVTSSTKEVTAPGLHSIVGSGWGADYGDVENFLDQIIYGDKAAYYSNHYTYINDITDPTLIDQFKTFTDMVNEAKEIVDDMDARYEAFAEAEAYLISHALTFPGEYENHWQLTHINDYSKPYALYGAQNYVYKNWETSKDAAYTAEDYAKFIADFNG